MSILRYSLTCLRHHQHLSKCLSNLPRFELLQTRASNRALLPSPERRRPAALCYKSPARLVESTFSISDQRFVSTRKLLFNFLESSLAFMLQGRLLHWLKIWLPFFCFVRPDLTRTFSSKRSVRKARCAPCNLSRMLV